MSAIGKAIGKMFGVKAPKAPQTPEDEKTPKSIPTEDDEDVRKSVLEREMEMRGKVGRDYTRKPGRSLGGGRTTLG
jgi:hypothetical protein